MTTATATKPREIGLLFTPENLRLVRAGLKWQKRWGGVFSGVPGYESFAASFCDDRAAWIFCDDLGLEHDACKCPYGNPQVEPVRYYLKEAVQVTAIRENIDDIEANVLYLDDGHHCTLNITGSDYAKLCARSKGWYEPTTAMFMLKSFARTWLTGKRTWPERLGDMSAEDAVAEGIEHDPDLGDYDSDLLSKLAFGIHAEEIEWKPVWRDYLSGGYDLTPVQSYATLWDSINGPGSWQADKWVWCVEWEVMA